MLSALITGASSGIGEAFALQLSRQGYHIILVARRHGRLVQVKKQIESHGGSAQILLADLTEPASLQKVIHYVRKHPVDLLVNNAGIGLYGTTSQTDPEQEEKMIHLNISALVALTRAALPPMLEKGAGGIINLGSTSSFFPTPYMTAYGATKAFVLHYSEGLARELKESGVTVTALCPGSTQSEFAAKTGIRQPVTMTPEAVVKQALSSFHRKRPVAVTGFFNRLVTLLPRFLTRQGMTRVIARAFRNRHRY
ncbi:SDR family oxidoreductase [Kroppenstedtia pulmonis]|uniref:SDR family oxidoreductase n=1 Tax=Kroppenstedtia pulmonis TaxID=1380685 RepID=A0A7D4BUU1_9BACL|nr:SDR family oxidoreductase [Kroppenstedtia pulmonis]QKG83393.1 SDR family oxidoreductase [Kroppenstedtia pulmonis]